MVSFEKLRNKNGCCIVAIAIEWCKCIYLYLILYTAICTLRSCEINCSFVLAPYILLASVHEKVDSDKHEQPSPGYAATLLE